MSSRSASNEELDEWREESFDGQDWEESVGAIRNSPLTAMLVTIAAVSASALVLACDASFIEAGPTRECHEVAAQCVLEKGPLGVCEQTPCADGESGPCLVCTPQH